MKIHIEILNNPSKEEQKIIQDYWAYENYDFVNKPTPITKAHDLTMPELISLIKGHSKCILNVGLCKECGIDIIYEVNSQYRFNLEVGNYNIFCKNHREAFFNNVEESGKKVFEMKMKYAVAYEVWDTLDKQQFDFFIKLISTANKDQICFNYLRNDPYEKSVNWKHIRTFQELGLLRVIRNKLDNKIIDRFSFHPSLTNKFVGVRLDSLINNQNNLENELQFKLKINSKRELNRQPNYFIKRRFDNSVLIEQGKEFLISAWIRELENTISISIIPSNKISDGNKAKDPSFKPAFVKYAEPKDPKPPFLGIDIDEDFIDSPF
jgi:hypothetical protein